MLEENKLPDLVRFVMINQRNLKFNFSLETYTNTILTKLKNNLEGVKGFQFYSTGMKTRKCSIIIDVHEYYISFTHILSNGNSQLKVDISGTYLPLLDQNLHDLKIALKNEMIDYWEQCLWLEDRQSEAFSENLYRSIHSVENTLRRLINTILFYRLGGDWWEKYMPTNLKSTYSRRNDPYKKRARSFKDVHTNLMSIDTVDLVKILTFKTYKMKENNLFNYLQTENEYPIKNPSQRFKYIMSDLLNGQKIELHGPELTTILKNEMEIEIDFWRDFFEPWFSCNSREFQGKWESFSDDRNHVAHNKLIDFKLYLKYKKSMEHLLKLIEEAEKKFNNHLSLDMDKYIEELESMAVITDYETQYDFSKKISEESGVQILVKEEIMDLFKGKIIEAFDNIREDIYSRSDIEVKITKPTLENAEITFEIVHNYFNNKLHVDLEAFIDSSEAGGSRVKITLYYNNEVEERFDITFTNGAARFDEEQGCYLPFLQEELNISGLDKLEVEVHNLLDTHMSEIEDDEIADFPCEDCGRHTINISEFNGLHIDIGTCLYCNHTNHIKKCIHCGDVINSAETNEACDSCTIHYTIA